MKLRNHLRRFLLLMGGLLLAFCAIAKLHEMILSRAAIRHFEEVRRMANVQSAKDDSVVPPLSSPPDFALWSEQRVQQYEETLGLGSAPPLAVIRIHRIHVEAPVIEGTDDITLNRGIGHIAGTAHFGESGNVGIAGHRDGFFRGLKDIRVGDRIDVEQPDRVQTYIVDQLEIVSPGDVGVLRSAGNPTLTLVTCYPFYYIGRAPKRFIVHAALER